jgi:hypothetical protein
MKIGYHYTLKNPQYENCEVLSPNGDLMFRCCRKKAVWYLDRNLGKKIKDEPLSVQLTFMPKGNGHIGDPYFLQEMENRCVICGGLDNLTRHHIVPYCYRRFFPLHLKNHRSYDVMALCIPCHRDYEDHAMKLKKEIAEKHSIPLDGKGIEYKKELAHARNAAFALVTNGDKIPPVRYEELLSRVKSYLNKEITEEDLQKLVEVDVYDYSKYVHHGKAVMEKIQDIEFFIKTWRQHFLDTMNPQFLPKHWTIDRSPSNNLLLPEK